MPSHTWAAFPSSLFLWRKPEPCCLTTLATASWKRSLVSRTYSLMIGTNVHEKVTRSSTQGMKCHDHGQDEKCYLWHIPLWTSLCSSDNPPWAAPLMGLQWKSDEMVCGEAFCQSQIKKKKSFFWKLTKKKNSEGHTKKSEGHCSIIRCRKRTELLLKFKRTLKVTNAKCSSMVPYFPENKT